MEEQVLSVRGLAVELLMAGTAVAVIDDVSFTVEAGRTLCIVGESGSGKSVTAMAIMGLLKQNVLRLARGEILLGERDLAGLGDREMEHVRGRVASIVFQDPMSSLNPVLTIGRQLCEPLRQHLEMSADAAQTRAVELLKLVGIPSAETAIRRYPHQLSGGQRQRVMIAMALACNPRLVIADEPTTALDVTTQAQILALLRRLQAQMKTALILITHDLGVVAEMADEVLVMYAGRVVEQGPVIEIFERPAHPYTQGLLKSIPPFEGSFEEELSAIGGVVPGLLDMPSGCAFAPRCSKAVSECTQRRPALVALAARHHVACIRAANRGGEL